MQTDQYGNTADTLASIYGGTASDYLAADGSVVFETNAGVNPGAAAATSPVVTNANGTSSLTASGSSLWSNFFSALIPAAGTAYTTATQAATTQAANAAKATTATAAANLAGAKSNTTLYVIAGVVVVAIIGAFLIFRRR